MRPWDNLSAHEFEEFCYRLLELNGFKNLKWHGVGGSDKGRDIVGTKIERPLDGIEVSKHWVIQCKHYKKAKFSKGKIGEWLAACREHRPNAVLLILSGQFQSSVKDWLSCIKSDYTFDILVWEETDLKKQYSRYGGRLRKYFPALPKIPRPVHLYAINTGEFFFACDAFSEAQIQIYNASNEKKALEAAKEFIEFIKANEFQF